MKHILHDSKRGFVFIELVVVLGILSLLLGLVIISISNLRPSAAIDTTITTFITDLKNQQTKVMVGDTEGRGVSDNYSVYIQPSSYTLFHGVTYSALDATNFTVAVDASLQLSTTFAGNKIVFATNSGEITNFVPGQDSITIRDSSTGKQTTIQINKYGAVTSVQ